MTKYRLAVEYKLNKIFIKKTFDIKKINYSFILSFLHYMVKIDKKYNKLHHLIGDNYLLECRNSNNSVVILYLLYESELDFITGK
jgi:hypothetical protein